jgi:hypothetical protein
MNGTDRHGGNILFSRHNYIGALTFLRFRLPTAQPSWFVLFLIDIVVARILLVETALLTGGALVSS